MPRLPEGAAIGRENTALPVKGSFWNELKAAKLRPATLVCCRVEELPAPGELALCKAAFDLFWLLEAG